MKYFSTLFLALLLASCTGQKTYRIGVSQCSEDDWRALLNIEIDREARFFGDIAVENISADDDSRKQTADIERFIDSGKDLIIVAPNVAADVQPAIEKAIDAGIPVILIDRRTKSDKYTAFIGADNRAIGQAVGEYILSDAKGRGVGIVELCGLDGSSPEQERGEGFENALSAISAAGCTLLASVHANWNEPEAEAAMDSLLLIYNNIDYVFAQNDRMAMGAYKAIARAGREKEIKIIGVDGLITPSGGVDMVLGGQLLATHTYPTGGSEAIQLAHKILTGGAYEREIVLPSALVDSTNARVLHLNYLSMKGLDDKYERLESLTDRQLAQLNTQRWILGGVVVIVLLIAMLCMTYYRLYREKAEASDMLMAQIKTLVEQQQFIREAQGEVSTATEGEIPAAPPVEKEDPLLGEISKIIESRMDDSGLSVNDIADALHMSRVQLYRRIKAISEVGLGDIIRRTRMERARQLLASGGRTVSEVAYQVGFSSPSYFTKCYKEYWGESPSAQRSV